LINDLANEHLWGGRPRRDPDALLADKPLAAQVGRTIDEKGQDPCAMTKLDEPIGIGARYRTHDDEYITFAK
jgi:hypothetical protein